MATSSRFTVNQTEQTNVTSAGSGAQPTNITQVGGVNVTSPLPVAVESVAPNPLPVNVTNTPIPVAQTQLPLPVGAPLTAPVGVELSDGTREVGVATNPLFVNILQNANAPALTNPVPVELSDGANPFGTESNPLYQTQMVFTSGAPPAVPLRTPAVFHTVSFTATGPTTVWTPAAGKKFRLMRFYLHVTANAALQTGAVVTFTFFDGATALPIAFDFFIPQTTANQMTVGPSTPWIDLGNGILSAAAGNALAVGMSAAFTTGDCRVFVCGTEE